MTNFGTRTVRARRRRTCLEPGGAGIYFPRQLAALEP